MGTPSEADADLAGSADDATGLGTRAARSAFTSLAGQLLKAGVQMLSVIVLARLLSVTDFGVVALCMAFIGLGEILRDFGLSTAAISAAHLTSAQRSNLFWINLVIGAVATAVLALLAPLLADVFSTPALAQVAPVLALVLLLNGASAQYRATLERALRFTRLALIEVGAPAMGLVVALIVCTFHRSPWILVIQQLTTGVIMLIALVWSVGWLPRRPSRSADMRPLLSLGGFLLGSQLLNYAANNTDSLVIGYRFGTASLGFYSRAFQLLMQFYNQVRVPITRVALPVLARLRDDPSRYQKFIVTGQLAIGYTVGLAMAILAGCATPLIVLLLGDRWAFSGQILSLLAIFAVFDALGYVQYWVYLNQQLTGHLMRYTIVAAPARIACVLIGSHWGVLGVAAGYAFAPILLWPASWWWLSRRAVIPLRELLIAVGRIIVAAMAAGGASFAATRASERLPALVSLVLAGLAGIAAVGALGLLPPWRRDVRELLRVGRSMVRRG